MSTTRSVLSLPKNDLHGCGSATVSGGDTAHAMDSVEPPTPGEELGEEKHHATAILKLAHTSHMLSGSSGARGGGRGDGGRWHRVLPEAPQSVTQAPKLANVYTLL
jgi:hypothetical protein